MDATGKIMGQNLDMTIEIRDVEGPEYQTKLAKTALYLELSIFDQATALAMNFNQSSNKIFDKNMAFIAMAKPNRETYEFVALYAKRYFVKIRIHGAGRFKSPEEVDAFVLDYTKAMSFPGR